ncbi:MAG: nucleoside triphosphate pyrophosphohydrolase [Kiritimatiellae bacterium]|nr:nucleoside triphosphate pyrophosphohydrolase [Kiritimatiellia bacterium]MDD5520011.1 nucleoside triphosphate pyrophosphohydrolase [Kiritimatiellia bacterium]
MKEKALKRGIERLIDVVSRLRGEGGCPWDREQTLDSLKQYLIEESYEVLDAIDSGDLERHKEELGDVLLQVVLHSQIRMEKREFDFNDVAERICDKLVKRHPHVFGNVKVSDSKEVLANWEVIKSSEKNGGKGSVLEGIPRHLPALQKAQRVQSRAARFGFDWAVIDDVVNKVTEEFTETKEAIISGQTDRMKEEVGDLLFAVVNLCRFKGIIAEHALEGTISKFTRRFQEIENRVRAAGKELKDCSLAELDAHWETIKGEE